MKQTLFFLLVLLGLSMSVKSASLEDASTRQCLTDCLDNFLYDADMSKYKTCAKNCIQPASCYSCLSGCASDYYRNWDRNQYMKCYIGCVGGDQCSTSDSEVAPQEEATGTVFVIQDANVHKCLYDCYDTFLYNGDMKALRKCGKGCVQSEGCQNCSQNCTEQYYQDYDRQNYMKCNVDCVNADVCQLENNDDSKSLSTPQDAAVHQCMNDCFEDFLNDAQYGKYNTCSMKCFSNTNCKDCRNSCISQSHSAKDRVKCIVGCVNSDSCTLEEEKDMVEELEDAASHKCVVDCYSQFLKDGDYSGYQTCARGCFSGEQCYSCFQTCKQGYYRDFNKKNYLKCVVDCINGDTCHPASDSTVAINAIEFAGQPAEEQYSLFAIMAISTCLVALCALFVSKAQSFKVEEETVEPNHYVRL